MKAIGPHALEAIVTRYMIPDLHRAWDELIWEGQHGPDCTVTQRIFIDIDEVNRSDSPERVANYIQAEIWRGFYEFARMIADPRRYSFHAAVHRGPTTYDEIVDAETRPGVGVALLALHWNDLLGGEGGPHEKSQTAEATWPSPCGSVDPPTSPK